MGKGTGFVYLVPSFLRSEAPEQMARLSVIQAVAALAGYLRHAEDFKSATLKCS